MGASRDKDHEIKSSLRSFLSRFRDISLPRGSEFKYAQALHAIHMRQSRVLTIELDDLIEYSKDNAEHQRPIPPPRPQPPDASARPLV